MPFSYLHTTKFWGIKFGAGTCYPQVYQASKGASGHSYGVEAYADANHGTGIDDKKSVSGFSIMVLGGPVSWASRTQPITAASTTESEYRALSECAREALWISKLLDAFSIPCRPFMIKGDSQGAIAALTNHSYTKHTKHIEIVHEFLKDRYQNGSITLEYIRGEDNPADLFTKCLGYKKFERFRRMLGMFELPTHLR